MVSVMAFDPSTRSTGWVLRNDGVVYDGGVIRARNLEEMLARLQQFKRAKPIASVSLLVIERPEIYDPTMAKADPNKISQLSIVSGACSQVVDYVTLMMPYPKEWKGSVPKHVTERRLARVLEDQWDTIETIAAKYPKGSRDDFMDALGLSEWGLRRRGFA